MDSNVTILGARGSVPVSDGACRGYGGATTSVLVRLGDRFFVFDAGTGILRLPADALASPQITLLLTHLHLDHLCGLSMCAYVMNAGATLDIYSAPRDGMAPEDALKRIYSRPIWPIEPDRFAARLVWHNVPKDAKLGSVRLQSMEGIHPGGVTLYRLSAEGKSVVFITDCTLTETLFPLARDFAADCDLLLCDGQYSDEEFLSRAGFGHSTWKSAARLGAACGAKTVRIVHHDPTHTDARLDAAGPEVRAIHPNCDFAREGEVIAL